MTTRKRPRNWPEKIQTKKTKRAKILEEKINKAIHTLLKESVRKDSRIKYKSNVKQFFKFCAENDILCFFALSFQGKMSGRTVRRKIGSIKAWHIRGRNLGMEGKS